MKGFFVVSILVASAIASAQVESFRIRRTYGLNTEPGGSVYFISSEFRADVQTTGDGDFDAFSVSGPSPAEGPFDLAKNGTSFHTALGSGTSPGEETDLFPLGSYTFNGSGGTLGPLSATLNDTAPTFATAPVFSNLDEYENLTAGKAVNISVNAFTPRQGATVNYATYTLIQDKGFGNVTVLASGVHDGSDAFSFGLPAGVTKIDGVYLFGVSFYSEIVIPNAGFGGATGILSSVSSNGAALQITTVPEPTSCVALGVGGLALLKRRRAKN